MVSAPSRRDLARYQIDNGLSERRSLRVIGMSPSSFRYQPVADRNTALKERIIALAQRHRRYGAWMIYLKFAPGQRDRESQASGSALCRSGPPSGRRSRSPTVILWNGPWPPTRCGPWISCSIGQQKDASQKTCPSSMTRALNDSSACLKAVLCLDSTARRQRNLQAV